MSQICLIRYVLNRRSQNKQNLKRIALFACYKDKTRACGFGGFDNCHFNGLLSLRKRFRELALKAFCLLGESDDLCILLLHDGLMGCDFANLVVTGNVPEWSWVSSRVPPSLPVERFGGEGKIRTGYTIQRRFGRRLVHFRGLDCLLTRASLGGFLCLCYIE